MIVSREGRFFNFDIVNPLWKSNGGRGRRPNFVFFVVGSVLFVSSWVAMARSKVLFKASWNFTYCVRGDAEWVQDFIFLLLMQMEGIEMQGGLKIKAGNGYGIQCGLLRINPRAWGEHLTSQLSSAATWLLVTCISPVYLVVDEFSPCVLRPFNSLLLRGPH